MTPFMTACYWGRTEIIKSLLEQNIDMTTKSTTGLTAIMYAIINGHIQLAQLLHHRNNSLILALDQKKHSILHLVISDHEARPVLGRVETVKSIMAFAPGLAALADERGMLPIDHLTFVSRGEAEKLRAILLSN